MSSAVRSPVRKLYLITYVPTVLSQYSRVRCQRNMELDAEDQASESLPQFIISCH